MTVASGIASQWSQTRIKRSAYFKLIASPLPHILLSCLVSFFSSLWYYCLSCSMALHEFSTLVLNASFPVLPPTFPAPSNRISAIPLLNLCPFVYVLERAYIYTDIYIYIYIYICRRLETLRITAGI
jgi:hypothetical protein